MHEEEPFDPLLPRRPAAACGGGDVRAASLEKLRAHFELGRCCTPSQRQRRTISSECRGARGTESPPESMRCQSRSVSGSGHLPRCWIAALGALGLLLRRHASSVSPISFDAVGRALRGPIDGPNVVFLHHASLSGSIMLDSQRGRESMPFFRSMQEDPNMFVFERHLAGSGSALDALPALMMGCLPYSDEGVEYAQIQGEAIGHEFRRRGYPTASFSSGARDDTITNEQRDAVRDSTVGGMDRVFAASSRRELDGSNIEGGGDDQLLQMFEEWMLKTTARGSPVYAQFHLSEQRTAAARKDPGGDAYYRSLAATDAFLKGLFEILSKNGRLENTVVIGSGDYGEDPMRGVHVRLSAWTPSVLHTAAYMYYPRELMPDDGVAETLRRNARQMTHTVDIFPTIRSVLGDRDESLSSVPEGCITGVDLTSVEIPDDRVAIATNIASSKRAGVVPARHKALITKEMALYRRSGKYSVSPKTIFNGAVPQGDLTYVFRFGDCPSDATATASSCEGFLKEDEEAQEHFRRALASLQHSELVSEGAKTSDVVRFFAGQLDGNDEIDRAENEAIAGSKIVVTEDGAIEVVPPADIEEMEEEPEAGLANLLHSFAQSLGISSTKSDDPSCDDILLFMPNTYLADLSPETQLNDYLLAASVATFMDKALVVLDAPKELSGFESNSQFGCPAESDEDLPPGLERLVRIPEWLSRGCAVPCQRSHGYLGWNYVRQSSDSPEEVCTDDNGRETKVFVLGSDEVRDYYVDYFKRLMLQRPSPFAHDWALRLGAEPEEAEIFAELNGDQIWDYLSALVARSDLLQFQPWIDRDVEKYLDLNGSYDAIHVRRGHEVLADEEARSFIVNYWDMRGLYNKVEQTAPHNYIPLRHYLRHYVALGLPPREIYISTNDPEEVEREIAELGPRTGDGILINSCFTAKFTVGRPRRDLGAESSCADRYANTIATVADLEILRKSETFVGEFNSDLPRLVRVFRKTLNEGANVDSGESSVLSKDIKMAWGYIHPGAPGW